MFKYLHEKFGKCLSVQLLFVMFCMVAISGNAYANHPVLVEGESDFDGDGLIGVDEDLDGDRVFGRLAVALAANLGAINNNGKITIVTSGRFPESLLITGANGNVTLEAAPGVEANIDAVLAGVAGNVNRQTIPGIVVDAGGNRRIILRNLVVRNWSAGIVIQGNSHVVVDNCRIDQNLNYGIRATGSGVQAAITNSQVTGTGFRIGAAGNSPEVNLPNPGIGIQFEGGAKGVVSKSSSIGNFSAGLKKLNAKVKRKDLLLFDNGH